MEKPNRCLCTGQHNFHIKRFRQKVVRVLDHNDILTQQPHSQVFPPLILSPWLVD
jgi:hypothetical protein